MPCTLKAQVPQCDVCNGGLAVLFEHAHDPQTGEAFTVLQCTQCGLGHTTPQPDDLDRYYGARYHGGRHGVTERFCMARRLRFVKAIGQPASLLDFGCGDGGFLDAASANGCSVIGVDMKPDDARARGFTVAERIDDVAGVFDLITLWHSLEHVRSPHQTLRALIPHLAEGGHIIIAVPNFESAQARAFGAGWFHLDVPRHLFHFTHRAMARLFRAHGLEVVQTWHLETEIDLFGWTQSMLNAVIPTRNVLFDTLTRRGNQHNTWEIAASLMLGTLVTVISSPLVPVAAAASRGAVMIFAGKKVNHG